MPTDRHAEFQVDVPEGWVNRTMVVWSAPASSAEVPPNVVVAFDRPRPDEDLRGYATRQVADLARSAPQFRLDLRRDTTLGGRPAIEVVFEWAAGPGVMRQRQVYGMLADGRVASVGNTARASDFAAADETFGRVMASFRWTS